MSMGVRATNDNSQAERLGLTSRVMAIMRAA
jgi:hypothetical protein